MKLFNVSSKFFTITHPYSALLFGMGNKQRLHKDIIQKSASFLFNEKINPAEWRNALTEIQTNLLIPMNQIQGNSIVGNNLNTTLGKWMYCLVRVLKPETIVETGVSHGLSSWIILNALHKNNTGKLYSIDFPNHDTNEDYNLVKTNFKTGWAVPEILKSKWELILGKSEDVLPHLLPRLNKIDLFFHDSEHTYKNMKWEFTTVLPYLKKDGIIVSDDVQKNYAFRDFVTEYNLKALQFNKGGCAIYQ